MYFAYFDESGNASFEKSLGPAFTLSAVLIHERNWLTTLDKLVGFRRYLRDNFGIDPLAELKANWLIRRKGVFKDSPLSYEERIQNGRCLGR